MKQRFAVAACTLIFASLAHAQTPSAGSGQAYPTRPVRLIVPYPAGGGTDIVMRAIQPVLIERLGQPVVIDNRPGATGAIGSELAARAAPDGYTLLAHTSGGLTIAPHTFAKPRFDPVKDFVPITQATSSPFVLVINPKVPATTLQQFIALAKSRPGELNYATSGTGSSPHLATLLLSKLAGIDMVHVPYKGSGPATSDLLAGHVQVRFSSVPPTMPHIKSGRLRGLATTGAKRFSLLPELPTVGESVPGYVVDAWYAVLAPTGTPAAIVRKLNAEFVKALQTPETQTRLRGDGVEPVGSTPQHLGELLRNDLARWAPLVKESGARAN